MSTTAPSNLSSKSKSNINIKSRAISKTISLPEDLVREVDREVISKDAELDWSKHVRKLVRADLLTRVPGAA